MYFYLVRRFRIRTDLILLDPDPKQQNGSHRVGQKMRDFYHRAFAFENLIGLDERPRTFSIIEKDILTIFLQQFFFNFCFWQSLDPDLI